MAIQKKQENSLNAGLKMAALILAVGLILAGCDRGSDREEGEDVTVTLGYNPFLANSFTDAPAPIDVIRSELASRYPDINLEYYTMPADMLDALIIWMTSQDTTVDIYGIDTPWVSQFGRAGWAIPLNDELPALSDNFVESGLDTFSYDGERIGVPFWGGVTGLYYRTDILDEHGFDPPASIEDMVEIIRTIRERDPEIEGFLWPGAREESLVMLYSALLHGFGGSYFEGDQYAFDSEASIAAVEFLRSTIEEGLSPRSVMSWERLESRNAFVNGTGIFSWDNHDIITWLDDPEQSAIAEHWDLIPMPATSEGRSVAITGGFAFAANPYSPRRDATLRVLEVIASEPVQRGFALAWGPVQYFAGLYEDPEVQKYNPNVEKLPALLEIALDRPTSRRYAELSGILQEELNAAVTGTKPVVEALENAQRRTEGME